MDFNDTPEEAAFRKEVRAWLDANATRKSDDRQSFRARNDDPELLKKAKAWQDKKAKAGYARITWPKEYGGQGARPMEQAIVADEMARAGAPAPTNGLGLGIVGPTIVVHGTDAHCENVIACGDQPVLVDAPDTLSA